MKFDQNRRWVRKFLLGVGVFAAVVGLTGCGVPKNEHAQVIRRAESAQKELEMVRKDSEDALAKLRAELETERSEASELNLELEAEVKRLGGESERASKALEELRTEFEAYRKAYRVTVRKDAKGLSIDELRTLTGKVYRGVKVRSLDARGVSFVHDSGSGSVELRNLEPVFHAVLGYDPRDAEETEVSGLATTPEMASTGPGGVEKITGSWDRLVNEVAKEKKQVEAEIAANNKKRDAIVAQMKLLNSEIVRLDNEIIRSGKGKGELAGKKKELESQYTRLGAQLGRLD